MPHVIAQGSFADRAWQLCYRCIQKPWVFNLTRWPFIVRTRRVIRKYISAEPGTRILDICCGVGTFAPQPPHVTYVGLDIDATYVAYASKRYARPSRCTFVIADASALPFHRGTFSDIVWIFSLHHFSDVQARRIFARLSSARPRSLLVCDLVGDDLRGIKRIMATRDRGRFIRSIAAQRRLLEERWTVEEQEIKRYPIVLDHVFFLCTPKSSSHDRR